MDSETYVALTATVRNAFRRSRSSHRLYAGEFVRWGAERFRREFSGGPWRWQFLLDALGVDITHSECTDLTTRGLRSMGRRLKRINGRTYYLLSIAALGGIPQGLIRRDEGAFRRCLSSLIDDLARYPNVDADWAANRARCFGRSLPGAFQSDEFFALLGDLGLGLAALRRETPCNEPDVVEWLDINRPDWRDDLPLSVDDDATRALLSASLVPGPTAPTSRLAERSLLRSPEGWREAIRIERHARISRERLGIDGDRGRLLPEGDFAALAPRLVIDAKADGGLIEMSRLSGPQTVLCPLSKPLMLGWSQDGARCASLETPGAEAIPDDLRATFWRSADGSPDNPAALRLLGAGPVSTRDPVVYLLAHEPRTEGKLDIAPVGETDSGRRLYVLRGSGQVCVDDDRIRVRTASDDDTAWRLTPNGAIVNGLRTSNGGFIHRGWPYFWLETEDGNARRMRCRDLRWRSVGEREWRAMSGSPPFGPVIVARFDKGSIGERCTIVTAPASLRFEASANRLGEAEFALSGMGGAVRMYLKPEGVEPVEALISGNRLVGAISVSTKPPALLALDFISPTASRPLELQAPFPQREGGFIAPDGYLADRDAKAALMRLAGWRAAPPAGGGKAWLQVRIIERNRSAHWRYDLKEETPLSRFQSDLADILSSFGPDAEARLRVIADGHEGPRLRVGRFEGALQCRENEGITLDGAAWRCLGDDRALKAINLRMPGWVERFSLHHLPTSPDSAVLADSGPWLITAEHGDAALRPAVWMGPDIETEEQNRFGSAMARASAHRTRDARIGAFARAFDALLDTPDSADWTLVETLLDNVDMLAALDQVQALSDTPAAAVALLFRASPDDMAARLDLSSQVDLLWPTLPLLDWVRGVRVAKQALFGPLEKALGSEKASEIANDQFKQRAHAIQCLRPDLAAHIAFAFGENDIGGAYAIIPGGVAEHLALQEAENAVKRRDRDDPSRDPALASANAPPDFSRFDASLQPLLRAPFAAAAMAAGKSRFDKLALRRQRLKDPYYFDAVTPFAVAWILEPI